MIESKADLADLKPSKSRRTSGKGKTKQKEMSLPRVFAPQSPNPYEGIEWSLRKASITDDKGKVIFIQDNIEVPKDWSMLATNIVASKYFYGGAKTKIRENSVRQLVDRVARTITDWGIAEGYFASPEDAENFYADLAWVCVNQYGSFNSPVWFNVGLHQAYGATSDSRSSYYYSSEADKIVSSRDSYKHPQASACFIQSVKDTMEDIMRLASTEAMLFKYGSGTGTDLSSLRSSREKLSGGGTPSGPLSFMRVFDQVAAVIKSGGKTRRAAKMQSLKISHPDVMDFITCKTNEEKKAWALIDQGYDGSFGGEAYESVMFQNANLSVRVTDEFMKAVENDGEWQTRSVTTNEVVETLSANKLMHLMAEGTHLCGDPGMQYDTTINKWHTCINSGRINASNPCSEYMFIDDSACNLASLNIMKFMNTDGTLDVERFSAAVRIFIIAQEILVGCASYPTEEIATNSHLFRPLGLGYANLGAVLMSLGLPYDSDEGRAFAAIVTAILTGHAYATSSELATVKGPFVEYAKNREPMLNVIHMHADALVQMDSSLCPPDLYKAAGAIWAKVQKDGAAHGFRNAQVTLLAPTGTIGFMMDCDTTGIEPDLALIKYKQLAGGGLMKLINRTVESGLRKLGYNGSIERILKYIDEQETIEGSPDLKDEHLPVFDCAFKAKKGSRCISYKAHLKMMAAVQPYLSGAISKTINMPKEAKVDDIVQAYMDGWKMGLKAIAIYRDGSKRTQPLNTSRSDFDGSDKVTDSKPNEGPKPTLRARMPATRSSITHKFAIAGHEGYMTVGLYEDGRPGELFITMAKEGSTVGGIMNAFGTAISLCLQYGVPLRALVGKFSHSRFEPSGYTDNPDIPIAKSLVDYIFRWLEFTFANGATQELAMSTKQAASALTEQSAPAEMSDAEKMLSQIQNQEDSPVCDQCGHITTRNGACYRCHNCGNSMGCS